MPLPQRGSKGQTRILHPYCWTEAALIVLLKNGVLFRRQRRNDGADRLFGNDVISATKTLGLNRFAPGFAVHGRMESQSVGWGAAAVTCWIT